jgi:beta-phosphoglucomutase
MKTGCSTGTRPKPFPDPYEEGGLEEACPLCTIRSNLRASRCFCTLLLPGLKRLGMQAHECIAFEDSFSGLASATAAGLRTVAVLTTRTEAEMKERGAFMAVRDFAAPELWEFIGAGR